MTENNNEEENNIVDLVGGGSLGKVIIRGGYGPVGISDETDAIIIEDEDHNNDGNNGGNGNNYHHRYDRYKHSSIEQDLANEYNVVQNETGEGEQNNTINISVDDAIERLGMGMFQYRILIAAGLCFASDSMEIMLLSFLCIVLKVQWNLSEKQTAFITSIVFIGCMVGTIILGLCGDKLGRRPTFFIATTVICISSFSLCLATSYSMLLLFNFFVGFGIGGVTVPFDILAEFLPTKSRGKNLLIIEYFWTFGTLIVPIIASFTLGHSVEDGSWQLFVLLCALPCLLSLILGIFFVPESPRWLCSRGRQEEALSILRKAAIINNHDPDILFPSTGFTELSSRRRRRINPNNNNNNDNTNTSSLEEEIEDEDEEDSGIVVIEGGQGGIQLLAEEEEHSKIIDLLSPKWRNLSLRLWGIWFASAFGYYGTILAITNVFDTDSSNGGNNHHYHNNNITNITTTAAAAAALPVDDSSADIGFEGMTYEYSTTSSSGFHEDENTYNNNNNNEYDFNYAAIFKSGAGEVLGTTMAIIAVDKIGRINSQIISYALGGICLLMLCILSSINDDNDSDGDEGDELSSHLFSTTRSYLPVNLTPFLIFFAFIARACEMAGTCMTWVSTAELLTTEIRTTGHATSNFMGKIGATLSPILVEESTPLLTVGIVMFIVHAVTVLCTWSLPETSGRAMGTPTMHPNNNHNHNNSNQHQRQHHHHHIIQHDNDCDDDDDDDDSTQYSNDNHNNNNNNNNNADAQQGGEGHRELTQIT